MRTERGASPSPPAAAAVWYPGAGGGHRPALDGVRGLAILLVLVHHQTVMGAATAADRWVFRLTDLGWCGVDLFFVLSGFLITGILLDARGRAGGLRSFYARRVLRIFPLYYAVLVLSFLVLPRLPETHAWLLNRPLNPDGQWFYWTYLSNFLFADREDFLHPVLGVSWSLAIEEQFYLVWPAVVWALGPRRLGRVCLALAGAALALRVLFILAGSPPIAPYVLPFTRMDTLAVGAWAAVAIRTPAAPAALARLRRLAPACAVVIAAIWARDAGNARWTHPVMLTLGFSAFAGLFGWLVLELAMARGGRLHRFFTGRLIRAYGRYSYAIYLLHWPVQVFVDRLLFQPPSAIADALGGLGSQIPLQFVFFATASAACLGAGWLSWHLLERHFLALKRHVPMPGVQRAMGP